MTVELHEWRWQGGAGHFIAGDQCAFHLATVIGNVIVSTVGEYRPHSNHHEPVPIGVGRLYETMVFRAGECSEPGCSDHHQLDGAEMDFIGSNTRAAATDAHMAMCRKWAER